MNPANHGIRNENIRRRKMKMLEQEDVEALERQVNLWLENRGIPPQRYKNLPAHDKVVLHNLVCIPTQLTTAGERRALYRKLCAQESIAGRKTIDPVDHMTDEDLKTFFSSLPPSQGRLLVDWGCE
jgi:hypothetical protein